MNMAVAGASGKRSSKPLDRCNRYNFETCETGEKKMKWGNSFSEQIDFLTGLIGLSIFP
jgi:hypothetical protein